MNNKELLSEEEYLVYINSIEDIKCDFDNKLEIKLASIVKEDGLTEATDKEIAKELGLSAQNYATRKTENRLPLKNIVNLCLRKNVNINWVLYSKQLLWKQEKATKAIQHYTECRANKYKRLYGRFTGICDGFVRFTTVNILYSCKGDGKDLPIREIRYIKKDDIFGPGLKKSKNWGFVAWFIILLGLVYYLGYQSGKQNFFILEYNKKISLNQKTSNL